MDFKLSLDVTATLHQVNAAIASSEGISRWWSKRTTFYRNGHQAILHLEFGAIQKRFLVNLLSEPHLIKYTVLDCTLDEWVDTTVLIALQQKDRHTVTIALAHLGMTPQLLCYPSCAEGWAHFMASLKAYLETGVGQPH